MAAVVHDSAVAQREKSLVALSSVGAAVLLTSMKVVVGLATGSIGILSEAAHSGIDLVAALMTFWAVRVSSRPPDQDHLYGHGKIENFSALFETGLLLATCVWIAYEATKRLVLGGTHVEATVWSFLIMAVSIIVDVSRSRALANTARKHRSQALEADALHFSTDVWSSAVVLVGLAGVWFSHRSGLEWLARADSVAALGVAGIAALVSVRLGRKAVDDLLDAAPTGLLERIARAAEDVEEVITVSQVRVRRSGPKTFADVILQVARGLPVERAHEIAHRAEDAIHAAVLDVDVMVHTEPAENEMGAAAATEVPARA
jgi:cation diffusion facilitator family transporter